MSDEICFTEQEIPVFTGMTAEVMQEIPAYAQVTDKVIAVKNNFII